MADDTQPITVGGNPAAASAVSLLRTLLTSAGAVAAVLHFAHVSGALQALAGIADTIVGGVLAAAGLVALIYGTASRWRIAAKAKAMANKLPDEVARVK